MADELGSDADYKEEELRDLTFMTDASASMRIARSFNGDWSLCAERVGMEYGDLIRYVNEHTEVLHMIRTKRNWSSSQAKVIRRSKLDRLVMLNLMLDDPTLSHRDAIKVHELIAKLEHEFQNTLDVDVDVKHSWLEAIMSAEEGVKLGAPKEAEVISVHEGITEDDLGL